MLTQQERQDLNTSIDAAIETANRMKDMISSIAENRQAVEQILITQNSIDAASASNRVTALINLTGKLDGFIESIPQVNTVEDNIPDIYKAFIQKEFVLFSWDLYLTEAHVVRTVKSFLEKQEAGINITPQDSNTVGWLCSIPDHYPQYASQFEKKIATYQIFDKIKWINNNIVMIGANGSGKSTFSRQLSGKISSNISILSAQHLLVYRKQNTIPANLDVIKDLRAFQRSEKLSSDSDFASLIGNDMDNLITTLIADHTNKALAFYSGSRREPSHFETTVKIWQELIVHRELFLMNNTIFVKAPGQSQYSFNNLSDGEKAVFYYVGHVLLVEPNSYIIVDEPENHLHLAICNKLWDRLEQQRPDCKFIYLTHNLDFAASRTNTTLIWNKRFRPPSTWDFQIIEPDGTLPSTLLMEVLGSRKKVCFCEGTDKAFLDYKLYSTLFPEYTVIPVGGHLDVINYTNAFNKLPFRPNDAVGIIDGDCHRPEQIAKWKEQGIYTLPVNEIENLLCDSAIIDAANRSFMSKSDAAQRYYDSFWHELEQNRAQQATWYVNNALNNRFKENFLREKQNIADLKAELCQITSSAEIDALYAQRLKSIDDIIARKNYDAALAIANFKGKLTKHIAKNAIVDNYSDRVLGLIKSSSELQAAIKQKYFADFLSATAE